MTWKPTVLVLSGGGTKGGMHLGALAYAEQKGYLDAVHTFMGVSVGAVISLLLAAKFSINEIMIESMKFTHLFQDLTSLSLSDIRKNTGLLNHEIFREKLSEQMQRKFGFVPSLKQLYMMTGRTLVTVSFNFDRDIPVYFSHETRPEFSSVDAVLFSMNIPFLFYKLYYKGEMYIDGAFGDPYPVHLFDDGKTDILGIHISTQTNPKDLENSIILYLYKVIICAMTQLKNRIEKASSSRCRHLELLCPVNDFTGISANADIKIALITSGYKTSKSFFETLVKNESIKEKSA